VTWVRFFPLPISILTGTLALDGTLGPIDQVAGGADRPGGAEGGSQRARRVRAGVVHEPGGRRARLCLRAHDLLLGGAGADRHPVGNRRGFEMQPTVALANNGVALAVWQRALATTGVVEGAAFSAAGAVGPATQRHVLPYGGLTAGRGAARLAHR
jgi:hypothetical protein